MKRPEEVAMAPLVSVDELKRRATTRRRLSTSLRAQAAGRDELSEAERKLLTEAAALLDEMARVSAKAAAIKAHTNKERDQRIDAVRALMMPTFGALVQIDDRIALVGSVTPYALKGRVGFDRRDADVAFQEALETMAYQVANECSDEPAQRARLTTLWDKFQSVAASMKATHQTLIEGLERGLRHPR